MVWRLHFNIWRFDDQAPKFAITDTKFYVPVVTLSIQANVKLLDQLKHVFKKSNWNKYQLKVSTQTKSQYLDYFVDPRFQGVNRLFVLSFENNVYRTSYKRYFLKSLTIKDYSVMIVRKEFFDQ